MKRIVVIGFMFILLASFQKANTGMRITVLNRLGNPVDSAAVKIYASAADYREEKNSLREARFTDENGKVTYKKLKADVYFVQVVKGALSNDALGVQTDTLMSGKLNKINIILE